MYELKFNLNMISRFDDIYSLNNTTYSADTDIARLMASRQQLQKLLPIGFSRWRQLPIDAYRCGFLKNGNGTDSISDPLLKTVWLENYPILKNT
jgi:hypothetical protein